MTVFNEARHAGEFLVSEANGHRSREQITIASGEVLKAGHVLGRTGSSGSASESADSGNTGDGTIGSITVGGAAINGDYRLWFVEPATDAGEFVVDDPQGNQVGQGTVAVEFDAGGLTFTLADGDSDFEVGDAFTITVSGQTYEYKEYDPTNDDGSEVAAAILYDAVDAADGAEDGVGIVRDAEVAEDALTWFDSATDAEQTTGKLELEKRGIVAR